MRERKVWLSIFSLVCGTVMSLGSSAKTQNATPLRSFYIVTHFFSDDLPSGYDEILQVVPQGKDVCIRVIRISLANPSCGGQLVRAVERILQNTTVRKVTGSIDLCSHSEEEVAAALKNAERKGIASIEDSASHSIVVRCGTEERDFSLPFPETVDLKALHRKNPRVSALWDLSFKVRSRAFGEHFSFYDLPPDREKEYEDAGTRLLPKLVSGTFETGFGSYSCGKRRVWRQLPGLAAQGIQRISHKSGLVYCRAY